MSVRVISGTAKGHRLHVPRGVTVRPTPDRAKGALFNILGDRVVDSQFLDLYAGSGAIGIEALSRGAAEVVFVEIRRHIAEILQRNLTKTGLGGRARLLVANVTDALETLRNESKRFDIVFADPPYDSRKAPDILQVIGNKELLNNDGLVVWEHASEISVTANVGKLVCAKDVRYGDTSFAFLS
jgi:16S rRNA (guanine966-N2)-methyltransferase